MARRRGSPRTELSRCEYCEVRLIFPRTPTGKKLPPVEYGQDPLGTVAIDHKVTGAYIGRFLAKDEQVIPPETRHAVHHCEGSERRHAHRRGRSANQRPTGGHPRRAPVPAQPTLI